MEKPRDSQQNGDSMAHIKSVQQNNDTANVKYAVCHNVSK